MDEGDEHESIIDNREIDLDSVTYFSLAMFNEKWFSTERGSLVYHIKKFAPDAFKDLPYLKRINIFFVGPNSLDNDFIECQALEKLKHLQDIELSIETMSPTIKLKFNFNHLEYLSCVSFYSIKVDMVGLKHLNLESLSLEDCKLLNFNSDWFANMPHLSSLVMTGCGLEEMPNLSNCSRISLIYVHDNLITELHEDTFKNHALLELLTLSGNPIREFKKNLFKGLKRLIFW